MRTLLFSVFGAALLAACGGGDGSSSAPSPPPTGGGGGSGSSNAAPAIVVKLSKDNVLEQQGFWIDLNDSSDSDGNITTYEIRQTNGPTATQLENVNAGRFVFEAPDFTHNSQEMISFQATVTDEDGASASSSVTISVQGYDGAGKAVALFDPPLDLIVGNGATPNVVNGAASGILGSREILSGPDSGKAELVYFGELQHEFNQYDEVNNFYPQAQFQDLRSVKFGALWFNLYEAPGFSILSTEEDRFRWLAEDLDESNNFVNWVEADGIDLENPCYLTGRTDDGMEIIWIGQENGFSTYILENTTQEGDALPSFDATLEQRFVSDRSLCHIFPTLLPRHQAPRFVGNDTIDYPHLLAVDFNSNELVFLADTDDDHFFEELGAVPLQTESDKTLEIVDIIPFGLPSLVPRYLAILMTDGEQNGDHRLVYVFQNDPEEEFTQKTFHLNAGLPVALVRGTFWGEAPGNQFKQDLVVITNTSEALYFDNGPKDLTSDPENFLDPITFEVRPGAGSAVSAALQLPDDPDQAGREGILISYPDDGMIVLYDRIPE